MTSAVTNMAKALYLGYKAIILKDKDPKGVALQIAQQLSGIGNEGLLALLCHNRP